jgi:2-methylisocitrate lyase-like PEP mutase family enzyme
MDKCEKLRKLLEKENPLIMPDAYDPLSAKMIEKMGFKAVQCSGYSFSVADGLMRELDISLEENLNKTRKIVDAVNIPVMADGEDGYGGIENIKDTINLFMDIGVAGINLEDQLLDNVHGGSICKVIDSDFMQEKITLARETANERNPKFIINGRTDALRSCGDRSEGLEIAIDRANSYLASGADLAFITYVENLKEVKTITKKVKGPVSIAAGLSYNIDSFSMDDLKKYGVKRVSLPTLLLFSTINAMKNGLNLLKKDSLSGNSDDLIYSPDELKKLLVP